MENSKVFFSSFHCRAKKRNFFLFERREKMGFRSCTFFFLSFFLSFFHEKLLVFMHEIDSLCNLSGHGLHTLTRSVTRPSWEKPKSMFIHFDTHYIEHIKAVSFYDPNALSHSLPLSVLISFKYDFCIYFFFFCFVYLFQSSIFCSSSMSLELLQWKQSMKKQSTISIWTNAVYLQRMHLYNSLCCWCCCCSSSGRLCVICAFLFIRWMR